MLTTLLTIPEATMPKKAPEKPAWKVNELMRKPGFHAVSPYLYLKVVGNSRSWVFRYLDHDHRRRDFHLGTTEVVTLDEARDKVIDHRRSLRAGIDPLRQKREQAIAMTMQTATEGYISDFRSRWNKGTEHQFSAQMTAYVYPVIGKLPVAEIDQQAVLRVIKPMWSTKGPTANRVRSQIEKVLDWAKAHGHREGDNPADWEILKMALPPVAKAVHRATMEFARVPEFMPLLRSHENRIAARALEFLILTASRLDEVREAVWGEIDETARIWTIPAARMKGKKEHKVPLSDRAIAILDEMRADRAGDAIFPGGSDLGFLGEHTMQRDVLRKIEPVATVHGFRSSLTNWATNRTSFDQQTILWCIAHITGSASDQAYRTDTALEKRRMILDGWASFIDGKTVATADIVPLRA